MKLFAMKIMFVIAVAVLLFSGGCGTKDVKTGPDQAVPGPSTLKINILVPVTLEKGQKYQVDENNYVEYTASEIFYYDTTDGYKKVLENRWNPPDLQEVLYFKVYGVWNGQLLYASRLYSSRFAEYFLLDQKTHDQIKKNSNFEFFASTDNQLIIRQCTSLTCSAYDYQVVDAVDMPAEKEITDDRIIVFICGKDSAWKKCS